LFSFPSPATMSQLPAHLERLPCIDRAGARCGLSRSDLIRQRIEVA